MRLVAITERHVDQRLAERLVVGPLVSLAVDQHVVTPDRLVHHRRAPPVEHEVGVGREVDARRSGRAQCLQRLRPQVLLLLAPDDVRLESGGSVQHSTVDLVDDPAAAEATLDLARQPGRALPGRYRFHADNLVAQPLQRAHAHPRGLALADRPQEQDLHPILRPPSARVSARKTVSQPTHATLSQPRRSSQALVSSQAPPVYAECSIRSAKRRMVGGQQTRCLSFGPCFLLSSPTPRLSNSRCRCQRSRFAQAVESRPSPQILSREPRHQHRRSLVRRSHRHRRAMVFHPAPWQARAPPIRPRPAPASDRLGY